MDRRNLAIILTFLTVILCACPGLASLCFSTAFFLAAYETANFGASSAVETQSALAIGFFLVCGGLFGLAVPIGVAFFMFRKPRRSPVPVDLNESLPPAI